MSHSKQGDGRFNAQVALEADVSNVSVRLPVGMLSTPQASGLRAPVFSWNFFPVLLARLLS